GGGVEEDFAGSPLVEEGDGFGSGRFAEREDQVALFGGGGGDDGGGDGFPDGFSGFRLGAGRGKRHAHADDPGEAERSKVAKSSRHLVCLRMSTRYARCG